MRTAAQLEQSGSHEHWINTEVKTEVESLIRISDSDSATQDTELNVRLDRLPSQNLLFKGGEEVKITFLLPAAAEVAEPAVKKAEKNATDKFDTSLPRDHPCALFPLPKVNRNRSRRKKGYRRKGSTQLTALCAMPSDDSPLLQRALSATCPLGKQWHCSLRMGKAELGLPLCAIFRMRTSSTPARLGMRPNSEAIPHGRTEGIRFRFGDP